MPKYQTTSSQPDGAGGSGGPQYNAGVSGPRVGGNSLSVAQAMAAEDRRHRMEYERIERQLQQAVQRRPASSNDWMIQEWENDFGPQVQLRELRRACPNCGSPVSEGSLCVCQLNVPSNSTGGVRWDHAMAGSFAYQMAKDPSPTKQAEEEVVQLVDGPVGSAWSSLPNKKY